MATVLSVSDSLEKPAKVIDVEVLSNYCDTCEKRKDRPTPHQCQKNFTGAAGSMEPEGMLRIFRRSEELYGLKYTEYLGDRDSTSYKNVSDAAIYDQPIDKLGVSWPCAKTDGKAVNGQSGCMSR